MPGAGPKKPRVPSPEPNSDPDEPSLTKDGSMATRRCRVPKWQRKKFIFNNYPPVTGDYDKVFRSLFRLHNESCNIYTHMVPALLLPFAAPIFLHGLGHRARPPMLGLAPVDYAVFGTFFGCAEICLVLSTLYHLLQSHSKIVERFWHGMDLLGIVVVTVGTFFSGIYYVFFCEASLQRLQWVIILTTGTVTAITVSHPLLRTSQWRNIRVVIFVAFGSSAVIPLVHGVLRYGFDFMFYKVGMKWYLLELALYASGVFLYGFRIPERLAPGRFDIWGSSHQIFHVTILCAMYTHVVALIQGFETAHTLNVCQP